MPSEVDKPAIIKLMETNNRTQKTIDNATVLCTEVRVTSRLYLRPNQTSTSTEESNRLKAYNYKLLCLKIKGDAEEGLKFLAATDKYSSALPKNNKEHGWDDRKEVEK